MRKITFFIIIGTAFLVAPVLWIRPLPGASDPKIKIKEPFQNLDQWKPLFFPKIKEHSRYTVETQDGISYLKAESNGSASALLFKNEFNVYDYPRLRWRWKVDNVYQKGDAWTKEGDDYPLRIYVIFKYDPEKASGWERLKYGAAKTVYGEYPPHSSLNYVWSSKAHPETIIPNPYSDKAMMILLQKGQANVGKWIDQEVHILEDYRKAFKNDPPPIAGLAIMNDSDNTGEKSTSYVQLIEVVQDKGK